ncbi:hypothetical protein EDD11_007941 [Mortierella claussenii]|nr:hypothetical protein EDD11_007941 [Mortierella claussenii]
MREAKSSSDFEQYFERKTFLGPLLARVMLMAGDKDTAKCESLAQLHEKTILKFSPDNAVKFQPSDPVVFKLRAKNAKRILVRVFEIKTFEYLQQHGGAALGQKLNLDGLTPNWEHNLTLDYPPLEMHDIAIELPELANRRGAFVMDVISNGENSCAYFTKGCLDFIERQSVAGHVLTVIDENQEKLSDKCTVWLNGYYYKPNDDGDIIIPYRKPSTSSSSYIYLIHDGFTTLKEFHHRVESYTIKFACHVDHESFVAGSAAKVLVKPTIQIERSTVICPISLLEQVKLSIEWLDTNNISTTTTVPDFKIHDENWSEYIFQVPENLSSLCVTLSAKIKVISTGEYQDLTTSRRFSFSSPSPDQTVGLREQGQWQNVHIPGEVVTLLQKHTDGYRILALGKNGEKRPGIPLEFEVIHPLWRDQLLFVLRTDDNGQVHLGPLQDVGRLVCSTTSMRWQISGREQYTYPDLIHSIEGDHISLPLGQQDVGTIRKIALFSFSGCRQDIGDDRCALDDYTSHIRLENGLLMVKGLRAGHYSFRIGDEVKCQLIVAHSRTTPSKISGLEDFLTGSNPMLEVVESTKRPLYVAKPVMDSANRKVDIQLYNWSPVTRVAVFVSKFVPYEGSVFDQLKVLENEHPWASKKTELTPTSFRTGRVLGEEYQYILNRKGHSSHWIGNLLTKPSMLLSPWSIAETTIENHMMRSACLGTLDEAQTPWYKRWRSGAGAYVEPCMRKLTQKKYDSTLPPPLLNFLAHPSVVLANLIPDAHTGIVSIPYSAFKEGSYLQIFALDGHQAAQRSFVVPHSTGSDGDFRKRDLRFKSQLDHTKHYIGERTGLDLDPKVGSASSVTLASNGSSSSTVRIVNSVSQVYDLMLTLLSSEDSKQTLRQFGFITEWNRLSEVSKRDKFSKWKCHELNLFLYKKDRPFFDAVVAPFLKNKLIKSFMDDYLIDAPLEKYLALHEFRTLTCMEKCLLSQRIPSLRPAVTQWIKDRVQNIRAASNVKLFLTVMNSGQLKESTPEVTSHAYSHTSPAYSPTSPAYSPTSAALGVEPASDHDEELEESDDDMGFGIISDSEVAPAAGSFPDPRMAPATAAAGSMVDGARPARISRSRRYRKDMNSVENRSKSETLMRNQFKPVDLTKEMTETYYYGQQDVKANDGDQANAFWLDFSLWDNSKGGSFLSQNFVVNAESFTSAMATIALLDMAFRPKDALLTRSVDHNLVITSQSPAIAFHSSIKELTDNPVTGSVLVTQQYFQQTEKTRFDEKLMTNVRQYIQSGAEFRPLESYGTHVIIMNATPNPMKVHLEVQIPQGSISIYDGLKSAQDIQLSPYGTFQYEYCFYFPEEGVFPHYPAHVSNYEDIIAYATPSAIKVCTAEPDHKETADTNSWSYLIKRGTKDQILKKLTTSPLSSLPVEELLPRLYKDRNFLQQVTSTLRARQEYNERIWSVALTVQNQELVKEYLMNQPASSLNPGFWFKSSVYERVSRSRLENSWENSTFKYLEYFPLINARAHKATRDATILNDKFRVQYLRFLKLLCQKPRHEIDDLLMLVVYLLAQDRIMEAKEKFQQLSTLMTSASGSSARHQYFQQLQYDYLWVYLNLCVEVRIDTTASDLTLDLAGVQDTLSKYKDYPDDRWNKMFKEMELYVDEIVQSMTENNTSAADHATGTDEIFARNQQQDGTPVDAGATVANDQDEEDDGQGPEVPVAVDFKIGSESVLVVRHRGVREVTVEYYSIDAETMFSTSPLTLSDQGQSESSGSSGVTPFGNTRENESNRHSGGDLSDSYRLVKPNDTDSHSVKRAVANDGILTIPLLPQYMNANVMISVSTSPPAATRTWKAYYSQTIDVQCMERTGLIKVTSMAAGDNTSNSTRPIRGGYVKVYAEMKENGEAVFWKDGYTDLVGRFAYAMVSTGAAGPESGSGSSKGAADGGLGGVKRFAVFVDGGREGCVVKSLPVPPV